MDQCGLEGRQILDPLMRRVALTILLLTIVLPARAVSPDAVPLSTESCVPVTEANLAVLGSVWRSISGFVQVCKVRASDGSVPLTVTIVRIDKAGQAKLFATHSNLEIPDPVISDTNGQLVGTLPEGFPVDPPGRLRVTFADWRSGFPWRIDLYEAGQSAVSPHPLPPLQWDPLRHRFLSTNQNHS
jgi:hypothetical protein